MQMRKTEIPSIRFRGFDDAWEQRKLGDIVERVVRKNTNNESSLPLTISAQYGLVDQITYFNNRVASRDVSNYYLVLNGEFAYNKSTSDGFPFGAVKRLDLYEKGVLSTLYIVFSIKNQSEIDSDYLTVFFDTDRWHKGVSERAAEGARNHGLLNISADDFFDIDIFLPRHKEEQVAIGSYLRHLDHLITLRQRKFEKLTNVKKSMLKKMFPQNGSSYPAVRFNGFTDPWEQRRFGDVFEEYSEKNRAELPPLTIVQGSGTIRRDESERALQYDKASLPSYKAVHEGDFIVHLRSFEGGLEKANSQGIVSPAYHTFRGEGIDSRFYYAYFRSKKFIDTDLKPHVYGIRDGRNIDIEGMKTIEIPFTSYPEQRLIGDAIGAINTLITLHQHELEKLQSIKKALLEKMFV
jgi:hypothetical protein